MSKSSCFHFWFVLNASSSRPFPPRFAGGVKYLIKAILHNNLAGHGPDSGEEDMLFLVSKERYGADTTDLKAEEWHVLMHQQWDFLDLRLKPIKNI